MKGYKKRTKGTKRTKHKRCLRKYNRTKKHGG